MTRIRWDYALGAPLPRWYWLVRALREIVGYAVFAFVVILMRRGLVYGVGERSDPHGPIGGRR